MFLKILESWIFVSFVKKLGSGFLKGCMYVKYLPYFTRNVKEAAKNVIFFSVPATMRYGVRAWPLRKKNFFAASLNKHPYFKTTISPFFPDLTGNIGWKGFNLVNLEL